MKALSWILVCWPLLFAGLVITASELSDTPLDHASAAVHEVAVVSDFSALSDSTGVSLHGKTEAAPVRP